MSHHFLAKTHTHSTWNRALPAVLEIASGDIVEFECHDSSGSQVTPASTTADFLNIDRGKIHTLTGPVWVKDAQPGDVLQIDVRDIRHHGWGWSSMISGLGFLPERFPEPYLFIWELEKELSRSLAPAVVPLAPFAGIMGVAPGEEGEFKTRPPGIFGGNMDVRDLITGSTLFLPVLNPGALFSTGDVHAAQGDGEVCINGIEAPANVTLEFTLHKGRSLSGPMLRSPGRPATGPEWLFVEVHGDPLVAARAALNRLIDFLVEKWGFSASHAYILCSVAAQLRLSQVVNVPLITVSAALPESILPGLQQPVF